MIRYKKSFLKNSIRGKKTSKHTIVKGASTSTFDDKMSVGVLILSHITGNGGKKFLFFFFFLKKDESLNKIQFSFLVPRRMIDIQLKRYTE